MGVLIEEIPNKEFVILFEYRQYLIDMVKALPSRKYNHVDKSWSVPVSEKAAVIAFALLW